MARPAGIAQHAEFGQRRFESTNQTNGLGSDVKGEWERVATGLTNLVNSRPRQSARYASIGYGSASLASLATGFCASRSWPSQLTFRIIGGREQDRPIAWAVDDRLVLTAHRQPCSCGGSPMAAAIAQPVDLLMHLLVAATNGQAAGQTCPASDGDPRGDADVHLLQTAGNGYSHHRSLTYRWAVDCAGQRIQI